VTTDRWEIQAKLPANTPGYSDDQRFNDNTPEINLMLQVLLEDRFQVSVHRERREMPVYALTIAKSGPKLKESTPGSQQLQIAGGSTVERHGMTGFLSVPTTGGTQRMRMTFGASTMQQAAEAFGNYFDRPVIDRTSLSQHYDFAVEYDVDADERGPAVVPNTSGRGGGFFNPFTGLSASALNASLQDLGLRLESIKAPVEVLVIDRVERPSEN
jgi:uncharacterized protein (TIGR03435 family)